MGCSGAAVFAPKYTPGANAGVGAVSPRLKNYFHIY